MTTGTHATARMLGALIRLHQARSDVEYEDRRAGVVTPAMTRRLVAVGRLGPWA